MKVFRTNQRESKKPYILRGDLKELIETNRPVNTVFGTFEARPMARTSEPFQTVFVKTSVLYKLSKEDSLPFLLEGYYCLSALAPFIPPSVPDVEGCPVHLPDFELIACWCQQSEELHIFKGNVSWRQIPYRLHYYSSPRSSRDGMFSNILEIPELLEKLDFIPTNVDRIVQDINNTRGPARIIYGKSLIDVLEKVYNYTYSPELTRTYINLIELYKIMANTIDQPLNPDTKREDILSVIHWYKQAVQIIDKFVDNGHSPGPDLAQVPIALVYWYTLIGRLDSALDEIRRVRRYTPWDKYTVGILIQLVRNHRRKIISKV